MLMYSGAAAPICLKQHLLQREPHAEGSAFRRREIAQALAANRIEQDF